MFSWVLIWLAVSEQILQKSSTLAEPRWRDWKWNPLPATPPAEPLHSYYCGLRTSCELQPTTPVLDSFGLLVLLNHRSTSFATAHPYVNPFMVTELQGTQAEEFSATRIPLCSVADSFRKPWRPPEATGFVPSFTLKWASRTIVSYCNNLLPNFYHSHSRNRHAFCLTRIPRRRSNEMLVEIETHNMLFLSDWAGV